MFKVALVGVGGISGVHIPAWEAREDAQLVALCDVRPEQMARFKDSKRCYTDFDEMLANEEIDILDICLPTYLHADFAVKAMEKGINVICEKPISLKKADVERVYGTAAKNNVKFMVAQVLRFWPEYVYVKKLFDEQTYGKLLSGSMTRLGTRPKWSWDNWMTDRERSGLVPFDLHIHDLDFMVYAFGAPANHTVFKSTTPTQDYFSAVYEFGDFFISTEASWYAAAYPFRAGFRFQFEHAVVEAAGGELKIYLEDGSVLSPLTAGGGDDSGIEGIPKSDAYANEINYFADCVKNHTEPAVVRPQELETVLDILNEI